MNLEIGTKLKVIKDIYYIVEDSIEECSYLTKEELFESVSHLLVKDDVWVVVEDNVVECIEGLLYGEEYFDCTEVEFCVDMEHG